jgi:ABC-2 type transport system ATP-binding protein
VLAASADRSRWRRLRAASPRTPSGPDARREDSGIESKVAVRLAGVTRRFNGTEAVSGLDLEIPAGTITGVIGPSGSGKTTTIRMITGLLAPTSGDVEVLGERPSRFRRRTRERLGYMPQLFSLYPDLTVRENVDFAAALYGLVLWRRWRRTSAIIRLLDLWEARGRRAGQLSGGMKRRLELAAALVHDPELLVLDEPTAGIDPLLRRTVWDELQRRRDAGVTAIVTTQYVTEAEECDLVALIAAGRLIAFGTPDEVRKDALGGEVVEVTMRGLYDAATLTRSTGVRDVRQTGPRTFQLIVDDAGTATPETVQAMSESGAEVESVREFRPTFEDVFAALVERDRAGDDTTRSDAAGSDLAAAGPAAGNAAAADAAAEGAAAQDEAAADAATEEAAAPATAAATAEPPAVTRDDPAKDVT